MKTKKTLKLNRETVRVLSDASLTAAHGGAVPITIITTTLTLPTLILGCFKPSGGPFCPG